MTGVSSLFVVLIVCLIGEGFAGPRIRLKRSSTDYILHKCTVTAELVRNNGGDTIFSPSSVNERLPSRTYTLSMSQQGNSDFHTKDAISNHTKGAISNHLEASKFKSTEQRQPTPVQTFNTMQLYTRKNKETPLKTINIEAVRRDRPLIFRKKHTLPELNRNSASRNVDAATTNVIVIKPAV